MDVRIHGTVAQTAQLSLQKDESLWASKGSIVSYSSGLEWDVRVPGGISAAVKRVFSGEGVALARIVATSDEQRVTLGANEPGHIASWDLADEGPVLTTRGAFLAAWGSNIEISIAVARRAGAALFGGAGLVLQRVEGSGTVLIHGRGDFQREELREGEEIIVSTGNLAAFAKTVGYDVQRVGALRKTLFGKEGFFMTRLAGPGIVLLQTLKRGQNISRSRLSAG
ncbi:MAG: hypothetical protein GTO42_01235 [Candidatus Latescibacteria bacterium]|nr:hypothetical protein [Candidatus Latescibacterota bacterium]NIO27153.1 hypothetical protein [Candidatus Latescibacterota bacterium]NIO54677.1 hypothetical protein [Candidatus Latescibacterota bacterium]NIT00760.1 hypothetical protein [Candidatus Latescibacterota bacterium]NIT37683.1 hypothetical protein [Candidatus Latescibacterota bacterium]